MAYLHGCHKGCVWFNLTNTYWLPDLYKNYARYCWGLWEFVYLLTQTCIQQIFIEGLSCPKHYSRYRMHILIPFRDYFWNIYHTFSVPGWRPLQVMHSNIVKLWRLECHMHQVSHMLSLFCVLGNKRILFAFTFSLMDIKCRDQGYGN